MLWDFGLNRDQFDNEKRVQRKIREIRTTFDLVMITERFDESKILLKDLLCWDFQGKIELPSLVVH